MKSSVIVAVLAVLILGTGAVAQADVLFNNFGPGDAYNTTPSPTANYETDWVTSGTLFNQDSVTQFGPLAATHYLTSVDLALSNAGVTDTAYIYLMSGAPVPTALVDYAVVTGLPTATGSWLPPVSVPFDSYELVPGEIYWIVVSTVDTDDSEIRWGTNSTGMTGGFGAYIEVNLVGGWNFYQNATPAMRVNADTEAVATSAESWGSLKALFR